MKKKFVFLISAPLVFFGVLFNIISHPVFSEKIADSEIISISQKEHEAKKDSFFLSRNYILPVEKISFPTRKAGKSEISINAKSALAIDDLSGEILYEKNIDQKVKIASLTKIATAGAVMNYIKMESSNPIIKIGNYNLEKVIEVSKSAVEAEGDSGYLLVGEKIKAGDLLKIMLIASSNDAARAIAEDITKKNNSQERGFGYFVDLMNNFAQKENLSGTHFTNPDGIDESDNYSTAKDIVALSRTIFKNYPEIFEITKISDVNIKSADGKIEHRIKNTNKLLGNMPGIVGGKTGYTDEAGESLLLIVEDSKHQHRIAAVVIGAQGRFAEMDKLVKWIWDAYEWK